MGFGVGLEGSFFDIFSDMKELEVVVVLWWSGEVLWCFLGSVDGG